MTQISLNCVICRDAGPHRLHVAREMMHGTKAQFDYAECAACGTVQITAVPDDLADHYCGGYYAFEGARGGIKGWLLKLRDRSAFGRRSPLGARVARKRPDRTMRVLGEVPLEKDQRILDVGCGFTADSGITHEMVADWERRADELNAIGRGDQALWVLRPKGDV